MRDRLRGAAAAALLVFALGVAWAGLYEQPMGDRLTLLAVLAVVPVLATLHPRRPRAWLAAALLVCVPPLMALVADRSLGALLRLDGDAWRAVARVVGDGLAASASTSVPVSRTDDAAFSALLDLAFVALVAGVAWQILGRGRPMAAVLLTGLAMAYRWTVLPPQQTLWSGTLALGVILVALALTVGAPSPPRRGRGARTVAAAAVTMGVAAVLAPGAVTQDRGWWDWRQWSVAGTPGAPAGLDIRQTYGRLDWPDKPRVVLRVRSPLRLPLRAAVLSEFDGVAFGPAVGGAASVPLAVEDGVVRVRTEPVDQRILRQVIRFGRFRSSLVITGGHPVQIAGRFNGLAERREGDTVLVDPSLPPYSGYIATITVNDPAPADLVGRTAYGAGEWPSDHVDFRPGPAQPPVEIPLWGVDGGGPPTDAQLGPYAQARAIALRVVGDAASPYVAVNRIERHLRSSVFRYTEAPPPPTGTAPPLVDFLTTGHAGFCQHFAGSMVLMLRLVGIPARVAVGFTPGRLNPTTADEYDVLDRDAHSWVEAYLPGAGWVDFDPTPGRAAANRASVSSLRYQPPPTATRPDLAVSPTPVAPPADSGPRTRPERPPDAGDSQGSADNGRSGVAWWMPAGAALLVLACVPALARGSRRLRGRHRGDTRCRLLAAVADMESALGRSGLAPPRAAVAGERALWLRERTGLDASALYAAAATARYGPAGPAAGRDRWAWRESRRVRRQASRRTGWPRRLAAYLGVPLLRRGDAG